MSQQPHPAGLGSPLTHEEITLDFSEALIEFVTPPMDHPIQVVERLEVLHEFSYQKMGEEFLWAASMPCVLTSEDDIPIATFGKSNIAKMKEVYRKGLSVRYGKNMQTIAGVHFNFSFPLDFWPKYKEFLKDDTPDLQDFISASYLGVIRNFFRYGWVLLYLFGSSPALCGSFLMGKPLPKQLEVLRPSGTYYAPYSTSLRMSDLGYKNNVQAALNVRYNDLKEYCSDLCTAMSTPVPEFEELGVKSKDGSGEWQQLNANALQLENEFYSSIRPKRPIHTGERVTHALLTRGVEYIEVRSLDLNVFDPVAVTESEMLFIEVFLTYCLLTPSPFLYNDERKLLADNNERTVYYGRDPALSLYKVRSGGVAHDDEEILLRKWGMEMFADLKEIARVLTENAEPVDAHEFNYYQAVCDEEKKLLDDSLCPSARVIQQLRELDMGYFRFVMKKSHEYEDLFKNKKIPAKEFGRLERQVAESVEKQHEIEAEDTLSFDEYVSEYFKLKLCN